MQASTVRPPAVGRVFCWKKNHTTAEVSVCWEGSLNHPRCMGMEGESNRMCAKYTIYTKSILLLWQMFCSKLASSLLPMVGPPSLKESSLVPRPTRVPRVGLGTRLKGENLAWYIFNHVSSAIAGLYLLKQ